MVRLIEKSGKMTQQQQVREWIRVTNRFYFLPQFSSISNGFLEGCIENVLMTVNVTVGTAGAGGGLDILCLNKLGGLSL